MGKPFFKASEGGFLEIYGYQRIAPLVNSSTGKERECLFVERCASKPFRRTHPCPFSENVCNIIERKTGGAGIGMEPRVMCPNDPGFDESALRMRLMR